jgi:hypothetical protein
LLRDRGIKGDTVTFEIDAMDLLLDYVGRLGPTALANVLKFLTETTPSTEPVNEMGVALTLAHYFEEQVEAHH